MNNKLKAAVQILISDMDNREAWRDLYEMTGYHGRDRSYCSSTQTLWVCDVCPLSIRVHGPECVANRYMVGQMRCTEAQMLAALIAFLGFLETHPDLGKQDEQE